MPNEAKPNTPTFSFGTLVVQYEKATAEFVKEAAGMVKAANQAKDAVKSANKAMPRLGVFIAVMARKWATLMTQPEWIGNQPEDYYAKMLGVKRAILPGTARKDARVFLDLVVPQNAKGVDLPVILPESDYLAVSQKALSIVFRITSAAAVRKDGAVDAANADVAAAVKLLTERKDGYEGELQSLADKVNPPEKSEETVTQSPMAALEQSIAFARDFAKASVEDQKKWYLVFTELAETVRLVATPDPKWLDEFELPEDLAKLEAAAEAEAAAKLGRPAPQPTAPAPEAGTVEVVTPHSWVVKNIPNLADADIAEAMEAVIAFQDANNRWPTVQEILATA